MFPHPHHPGKAPLGQPRPLTGEQAFIATWLGHLEAGRLGSPTAMTEQDLATLRASEIAVLGHAPSFTSTQGAALRRGW